MTTTEFLPQYLQILLALALIFFSTNEVIKLFDAIRILRVTRRVRKLSSQRSQAPTPMHPTPEPGEAIEVPAWKAEPKQPNIRDWDLNIPKLNWWAVTGITFLGIMLGLAFYILKIYQP